MYVNSYINDAHSVNRTGTYLLHINIMYARTHAHTHIRTHKLTPQEQHDATQYRDFAASIRTRGMLGACGIHSVDSTRPCSDTTIAADAPAARIVVWTPCVCRARGVRVGVEAAGPSWCQARGRACCVCVCVCVCVCKCACMYVCVQSQLVHFHN